MTELTENLAEEISTEEEFWNKYNKDFVKEKHDLSFEILSTNEKEILTEYIYIKDKIIEYLEDDNLVSDYNDLVIIVNEFIEKYWKPYKADKKNLKEGFMHIVGNGISKLKMHLELIVEGGDKESYTKLIKEI